VHDTPFHWCVSECLLSLWYCMRSEAVS
jgi:hypothetical protein